MKPSHKKAHVQFSSSVEANRALKSPEAVFGNRFIKVFWASRDKDSDSGSKRYSPEPKPAPAQPYMQPPPASIPMQIPKPNPKIAQMQKEKEDIRKSQLEQSKVLLESLTKMKNIDPKEKAAIMNKIQSLTSNVHDSLQKDTQRVSSKISNAPLKPEPSGPREEMDKEVDVKSPQGSISTEVHSDPTKTGKQAELERLQKRYQSLQAIAANMGLDPSQAANSRPPYAPRGRGTIPMGLGRGRGAMMTLDNRTTTLKLDNVPSDLRNEQVLKDHFKVLNPILPAHSV